MTEDFVGTSGKLEEEFVYAPNNNLRTEVFVRFEQRSFANNDLLRVSDKSRLGLLERHDSSVTGQIFRDLWLAPIAGLSDQLT